MAGARGHGDRKGRHYYTRPKCPFVYSSGGACPRHVPLRSPCPFLTIRPPGSMSQQLWVHCHELHDLLVLALTQTELGCRDRLFHLAGMT